MRYYVPFVASALLLAIPAAADSAFVRGDINADTSIDVADPVSILSYLFGGAPSPACLDAADGNDDGQINISDPIFLAAYLLASSAPPVSPFPE